MIFHTDPRIMVLNQYEARCSESMVYGDPHMDNLEIKSWRMTFFDAAWKHSVWSDDH